MNLERFLLPLVASSLVACGVVAGGEPLETSTADALLDPTSTTGGVFATFEVADERFSIWLKGDGARDAIKLWKGRISGVHPSGPIVCSTEWNSPWSWHLDGKNTQLAEVSIELCDGRPSDVEATGCGFANGRFCPWQATLVELRDCRAVSVAPPSCPPMPR